MSGEDGVIVEGDCDPGGRENGETAMAEEFCEGEESMRG